MADQPTPFDSLAEEDKKVAIDLSIALTVVACHCVGLLTKDLEANIIDNIATRSGQSRNTVKYALKQLAQTLQKQDWTFRVEKTEERLRTQFRLTDYAGPNGEKE